MPFANLPTHEKDAFFALLDEYFASRPDLLSRVGSAGDPDSTETQPAAAATAAMTVAQRALANPATSRALAAGLKRAASSTSAGSGSGGSGGNNAAAAASAASVAAAALPLMRPPPARNATATDGEHAPALNVGRVAAAAQAFSATPPPPRAANPPAHKRPESSGLVPQKKFGDVDVSSAGAMFRSLRGSTAAKNAPPAPVQTPPAFAGKKASSGFAPPPVRRVPASSPAQVPEPEEDVEPEGGEEVGGQWAEALYEYTSEDLPHTVSKEAGDLRLQAGETVLVTEQTSSDWWTGEVGGRSGLFPAAYVKLL